MAEHEPAPPPLRSNRSYRCFLGTQGLGALNDNLLKQVVMLLCLGTFVGALEFQAIVQAMFAIPFLFFSGLAGEVADRMSKQKLIVLCKVGEIVIMAGALVIFLTMTSASDETGAPTLHLWLLAGGAFFMGLQGTFFGPAKYGGLPELVRPTDLTAATGVTQMTTFFAVLAGIGGAGFLLDRLAGDLPAIAAGAVGLALIGTWMAFGIDRCPAASDRPINRGSLFAMVGTLRRLARTDGRLTRVMFAYAWFWLVGGVSVVAGNVYGRLQLGLTNFETSLLLAAIAIGIAVGSVIVARCSRGAERLDLVVPGAVGVVLGLLALLLIPVHTPTAEEIARFRELKGAVVTHEAALIPAASSGVRFAAYGVFFVIGIAGGVFSVPLLTFVQSRPAAAERGRTFAASNWLNWLSVLVAAGFYGIGLAVTGTRANLLFGGLGVVTAAVALWLVPPIVRGRSDPR